MPLDHIGVMVKDLARSRRFYEEALGMRAEGETEDAAFRILTMRKEGVEVHLFESKRGPVPSRVDHIAFRVTGETLARVDAELRERGHDVSGPHAFEGTRFIKVRDPDGIPWEIIAHDERS